MIKNEIRDKMMELRKSIPNKKEISLTIANKIMELDVYKKARVIAIYKSMIDEVDTDYLINNSFNKVIVLPKIESNQLVFVKIDGNTKYLKSKFNILEPIGEVYKGFIDLIIVPGIAFDNKLNRLGFGKGYYDKFLINKDINKIGICFDRQVISNIPVDEWDIKMDMIITEKRVLKKV